MADTAYITPAMIEAAAERIWRAQVSRLSRDSMAADRTWRDQSVPSQFWDSFVADARAALIVAPLTPEQK